MKGHLPGSVQRGGGCGQSSQTAAPQPRLVPAAQTGTAAAEGISLLATGKRGGYISWGAVRKGRREAKGNPALEPPNLRSLRATPQHSLLLLPQQPGLNRTDLA